MLVDILGTHCDQCVSMVQYNFFVHGNHEVRKDGQPRTATSTLTQLLNSAERKQSNTRKRCALNEAVNTVSYVHHQLS